MSKKFVVYQRRAAVDTMIDEFDSQEEAEKCIQDHLGYTQYLNAWFHIVIFYHNVGLIDAS